MVIRAGDRARAVPPPGDASPQRGVNDTTVPVGADCTLCPDPLTPHESGDSGT
jgi:hypothetical protein